jgi:hypothetical protein
MAHTSVIDRALALLRRVEGYARGGGGSKGGEESSNTCCTIAIAKFGCLSLPIIHLSTPTSGHLQEVPYQPVTKETCISHPWLADGGGAVAVPLLGSLSPSPWTPTLQPRLALAQFL